MELLIVILNFLSGKMSIFDNAIKSVGQENMEKQVMYKMRFISITFVLNLLTGATKSADVDILSELTILKEQFLERENLNEKKLAEMDTRLRNAEEKSKSFEYKLADAENRLHEAEEMRISVVEYFEKKITDLEEKLFENEREHEANEMNNDEKVAGGIDTFYPDGEKLRDSETTKLEFDSGMEPTRKSSKDNRTDSNAAKSLAIGRVPHKMPIVHRQANRRQLASPESHRVAFSSYLSTEASGLGTEHTIPFDQVLLNDGQSFDPVFHAFICPFTGIYMFQSSLLCDYGDHIETEIVKDGSVLARMYVAGDSDQHYGHDQGFNSAIVQCNKGEHVWVRVRGHSGNVIYAEKFSTFSGVLLWEIFLE